MPREQELSLRFPVAGVDERVAYRQQPPFTTPDALNVRPDDTFQGRERGGSRPGLGKAYYEELGGGNPVRLLDTVTVVKSDGFTSWQDHQDGETVSDAWSAASWDGPLPPVWPDDPADIEYIEEDAAILSARSNLDTANGYTVEIWCEPYEGSFHGEYRLYARMNNTTPVVTTEGVWANLVMEDGTGAYSGTLAVYTGGVATTYTFTAGTTSDCEGGWFTMLITGQNIKCYWRGNVLLNQNVVPAHAGLRMGFGLECTQGGGVCLVDIFRTQYYQTSDVPSRRTILCASANGSFYRERFQGILSRLATATTLASDRLLQSAERLQKLYIADWSEPRVDGTDGAINAAGTLLTATGVTDWTGYSIDADDDVVVISNVTGNTTAGTYKISSVAAGGVTLASSAGGLGTCAYSIERAPKVYDAALDTLTIWTADDGQVPTGCDLITAYRDRAVLGKSHGSPHAWYMSRQGDWADFDYAGDADDAQRAVAGATSDANAIGEPLTALITTSDDYLVFATDLSMWVLRGDPAMGGQINNLSRAIGVRDKAAWCYGPNGEVFWLSRDGLYLLAPGAASFPQSISRERLPRRLRDVDTSVNTIVMAYDVPHRGVHIWNTPENSQTLRHWWFSWESKGFWPVKVPSDMEPTAILQTALPHTGSVVLLGGRDGYVRRFHNDWDTDEGAEIESYVLYGPIRVGGDYSDLLVKELTAVLATDSNNVTWSLLTADTYEACVEAAAKATGTWSAGLNRKARPRSRGGCFVVKLENAENLPWSIERLSAVVRHAGRQRI